MKILLDMNLSPTWVAALESRGFEAVHWSSVGDGRAADSTIMQWAFEKGYIVFTNDLDFSAILAATSASAPSVVQVRAQDLSPDHLIGLIAAALQQHEAALERGALLTVEEARLRARILPLRR